MHALLLVILGYLTVPAPPPIPVPILNRPIAVWNEVWVIDYPYDNLKYWGYTFCEERRFYVVRNQSCPKFRETTIHEFMHAATDCQNDRKDTHEFIWNVSPAIEELVRLNPHALECLR